MCGDGYHSFFKKRQITFQKSPLKSHSKLLKRTGTYQIFQGKPEHGTIQGIHEWIITDTHFLWNNVRPLTGTSAN